MIARLLFLMGALVTALVCAIALGDQSFSLCQTYTAIMHRGEGSLVTETIIWTLRMPRAILGALVGAALGVAGAVTQSIMRNPLAEPGLIGINAGAAFAAVVLIVQLKSAPESLLPWATFGGACVMSAAIFALSWKQGTSSLRIILVGIGLSALAGAGASFISTFGDVTSVQRAMVWLAGSLQDSRWVKVQVLALWLVLPVLLVWLASRELDLIRFGDLVASGLGQRVQLIRGWMILAIAAISGAAVAAAGLVTFVGLAAPHIARRFVGDRHHVLIPAAAICGAIIVVAADVFARRLMPPVQLPVGLTTGILGAPFLGWLLWKKRHD